MLCRQWSAPLIAFPTVYAGRISSVSHPQVHSLRLPEMREHHTTRFAGVLGSELRVLGSGLA